MLRTRSACHILMYFGRWCRSSICVLPSYLHILRQGQLQFAFPIRSLASMTEASPDLPNYLEDFLAKNNDRIKAATIPHEDIPTDALIVKSLVWIYQRVNPVLVVLDLRSSVDKAKLAKYLNLHPRHMRMATPELVLDVTGQTVGNVSPIGHKQAVRTIVDESLLRAYGIDQFTVTTEDTNARLSDVICYGGGGSTGRELRISLRELLAVSKAEIVDVSASTATAEDAGDAADGSSEGTVGTPISVPADAAAPDKTFPDKKNQPGSRSLPSTASPTPPSLQMSKSDLLTTAKAIRDFAISRDGFEPLSGLLQSLQETTGDDADQLKEVLNLGTVGSGKTALHHAAWKGSIESVQALLALGADVNQYSTGPGNYGKTAIFYALTQCRDDVVALLLERGASVKIVNNKGQTPRSLAVSHVGDETIALIEAAETAQSAEWLNFYSSNYCDKNTCFGDLDPRFHDLGKALREQLQRREIAELPRSINETTFAFRRGHYQSYNKVNHLLDDVVVSFLSAKQAGTPPLLEALRSPIPSLSATVLPDGTTFVDGVLGRITQIDAESPKKYVLTLQPIRAAEGDTWRVQLAAVDGDYEVSDTAGAVCAEEAAQYDSVQLYFSPDGDAVSPFLATGSLRHFVTDLRVGQTIYANGTIPAAAAGDVDLDSCRTLSLNAHRVALFSTVAPATSESGKGKKGAAKKPVPSDAADVEAETLPVPTFPISFVALSDIASSFHPADGSAAVPVIVVNDTSTLALLESAVRDMVHEIQARAESVDVSVRNGHRLPHVVGMDCEWRPGMVFVRRPAGDDALSSLTAPIVAGVPSASVEEDNEDGERVITAYESVTVDASVSRENDVTGNKDTSGAADPSPAGDAEVCTGSAPLDYPVAVLQLATRRAVYLVDMQELTRPGQPERGESGQDILTRLSACLGQLFQHPEIVKLGFKAAPDFEKLACSYPELTCFHRINSVIDTCTLAQQSLPAMIKAKKLPASVLQGKPLKQLGLSRLCQVVLDGKGLDKAQQCSAWHLRPLTPEQMQYAALDAATLLFILDFFTHRDFAERTEPLSVDALLLHKLYRTLVFNIKFSMSPVAQPLAAVSLTEECTAGRTRTSRSGPGRSMLGVDVVTQQWAHSQAEPADYVPQLAPSADGVPASDAAPAPRTKGKLADSYIISEAVTTFLQSPAGQSTATPARDFLGIYIGQNKETCIAFAQALLHQGTFGGDGEVDDAEEGALPSALATTAAVAQGRKQGNMLLLKNTMLLFVNCTHSKLSSKANKEDGSKFLDEGKFFTWTVQGAHVVRENSTRATKTRAFLLDGLLHGPLAGTEPSTEIALASEKERSILVFVRQNAAPYVFCGRCSVAALTAVTPHSEGAAAGLGGSAVKVVFQLLEHDALMQKREGDDGVSLYNQMILDHI